MDLHEAFEATRDGEAELSVRSLGKLSTSGRIVAQDPLVHSAPDPFAADLPPGCHEVEVLLAKERGDTRVALARVRFSDAAPVRWEMALREGQDVRALAPGQTFGYGVDAGMGCFMEPGYDEAIGDDVLEELDRKSVPTWTHASRVPDRDGHRVVMFSSGWGDGVYTSWIGRDAGGRAVQLVTDFGLLDVELPEVADDPGFRQQRARELWSRLERLIPEMRGGGSAYSAAYEVVAELSASPDDAAPVVEAIWAARERFDDDVSASLFSALLGRLLRSPAVQDASLPRLDLSDPETAELLRSVSREIGAATRDAWLEGFDDAHPEVQRRILAASRACGALHEDPRMAPLVLRALDREPLLEEALGHLSRMQLQGGLDEDTWRRVEALSSSGSSERVRSQALDLLSRAGRFPDAELESEDPRRRLEAARALGRHSKHRERTDPVLEALVDLPALTMEERLSAATSIWDERAKVDALVRLGLAGNPYAAIQIRYVASELALRGLERLQRETTDPKIRDDAARWIERTRKIVEAKQSG